MIATLAENNRVKLTLKNGKVLYLQAEDATEAAHIVKTTNDR